MAEQPRSWSPERYDVKTPKDKKSAPKEETCGIAEAWWA
jgi:hypothetical protein